MSKYRNTPTIVDGIRFDSKAEARRYGELGWMAAAGEICDLHVQPQFPVKINGKHICTYRADFSYWDDRKKKRVYEDVKGVKTPVYKLKKKLVEALLDVEITEIPA